MFKKNFIIPFLFYLGLTTPSFNLNAQEIINGKELENRAFQELTTNITNVTSAKSTIFFRYDLNKNNLINIYSCEQSHLKSSLLFKISPLNCFSWTEFYESKHKQNQRDYFLLQPSPEDGSVLFRIPFDILPDKYTYDKN